jgi:3-oxoadipate enol-lactonase
MRAININGTNFYFRFAGPATASVVVFVNSLGTDWRVWEPVAESLGHRHRLLLYDKRGHGLSDSSPLPSSLDDHVADLAALLRELEISGALVCGISVGGMIALGLAAGHPSLVSGLVLADTGHRIGSAERWNDRIGRIRGDGMEAVADGVLEVWFTAPFRSRRPAETALWRNMLTRMPVDGYTATCEAIRDADLTQAARSLAVPALCLCGSEDVSTPPSLVRELSELISDSRYREIPGAAHLPTVEAPRAVARLIEDFAAELALG